MGMKTGSFGGLLATTLLWAFVWALPGGVIEAIDNVAPSAHSFTRQVDMWPQTLGLPGLVAGLLYSVLLLMTEGRRRFEEVALPRAIAWGAVAGASVGAFVVWGVATGLSEPVQLAAALVAYAALMGAASGTASVLVFRSVGQQHAPRNLRIP